MKKFNSIAIFMLLALAATVFVSCSDDDSSSPSAVNGSEFTADEPADVVTLGFQLNEPTSKDVNVTVSITGGTAEEGVDFDIVESSRTIAAGETNGSFAVVIHNDLDDEDNETVEFTITAEGISTTGKYTLTIADDDCPFEYLGDLVGTDANCDKLGFTGEGAITIALTDGVYTIDGLNVDWMQSFWEEQVVESVPVVVEIDGAGNITIDRQYIFTTLYSGANYDYEVEGTGVVNTCDGTVTIDYEIYNEDGDGLGAYCHTKNYMTDAIFKAVVAPAE